MTTANEQISQYRKKAIYHSEVHFNRSAVFRNRQDAGQQLAGLLQGQFDKSAVAVAIPAGGVPVAIEVALLLKLPLDICVASKITFPWTTESGYGAVAADHSVQFNDPLINKYNLDQDTIDQGLSLTQHKVNHRETLCRQWIKPVPMKDKTVLLIDDGLASGITMKAAIESVKNHQAAKVVVAVPTGHHNALLDLADRCDAIYCVNIREGFSFAVADAYQQWQDVTEQDVLWALKHWCSGDSRLR